MGFLAKHYAAFFERNIFERIIIYALLSSALVKLIFELALGQWGFAQAQNKQWFFYSFLMLDYALGYKKLLNFRVTFNPQSAFAILLLVMVAHGLFVGIYNHNYPFVIFNDTVPILMIALNIIRMQSSAEMSQPIDLYRLLREGIVILTFTSICAMLAHLRGSPALLSLENSTIFYPLLFAVLYKKKGIPLWVYGLSACLMALSMTDLNRTTLAFLGVSAGIYFLHRMSQSPVRAMGIIVAAVALVTVGVMSLPQDSKTYVRIMDFTEFDFSKRTGSVGERQAEMDAVQAKLDQLGDEHVWFGLGFGGLYEVALTHEYKVDYGHAHFSWVWFNLRFGKLGLVYLTFMMSLFVYNIYAGFKNASMLGYFIALISLLSLVYCFTYVNAIFLLSGLQFLNLPRVAGEKINNKNKSL